MMRCETHMVEKCPICKPHIQAASPTEPIAVNGGQTPTAALTGPVQNMNNITDPQAKNVLQLAQEYAQAQNDVATIATTVKQLQAHLAASKKSLADAEKDCSAKQWVLRNAITPKYPHTSTAANTVILENRDENEEPSYTTKYEK
jgi:hypothetical protein